ncbi:ParD-like family protein [Variovorax sp. HJSM1_2]|uniref:ParD-like family protein n=1 Tax=Variovorax sp. HJSM1_2 TaxID=3366263 RepID=UPI003BCE09A6
MGLVKISEPMHDNIRVASGALNRSINAQAEHWMRIGMMSELNPELTYGELCRLLIQDEIRAEALVAELPQKARA